MDHSWLVDLVAPNLMCHWSAGKTAFILVTQCQNIRIAIKVSVYAPSSQLSILRRWLHVSDFDISVDSTNISS